MSPSAARRPRLSARQVRRRRTVAAAVVLLAAAGAWTISRSGQSPPAGSGPRAGAAPATQVPPTESTTTPTAAPMPRPTPDEPHSATPSSKRTTAPRTDVRQRGTGLLVVVPGEVAAPGLGRVTTVRVEIEQGVEVRPASFAGTVLATLNDPRSWGHGGTRTFARTAGSADIVVVLASPDTSARLCRPLVTYGKASCRQGTRAVLTSYRWAVGTSAFADLAVYRQYVVNHEVGHILGRRHQACGGPGQLAPVMQQQTYGVAPCRPNGWPYP